jgi:6-phosphogluconolactonase
MKITRGGWLLTLSLLQVLMLPSRAAKKTGARYLTYIGTYTTGTSKGIYAYRFDAVAGRFSSLGLVAESTNPSFLSVDPRRRFLYAVNEIGNYQTGQKGHNEKAGGVSAFGIDRATGKLTFLNEVSSRGADPCYVSLDKTGKFVLVANYTGGSVAAFRVLEDGRLGEASAFIQHRGAGVDPERQEGPHAHSIEVSPDNRFALAADLGLDRLLVYRFDPRGSIEPNVPAFASIKPGSGPRHFAFHPNGHFVYVLNEMGSSISAFSYEAAQASLHELQTISAQPAGFSGHSDAAEIEVHPNGKFLYASNRGHDSIAVLALDPARGTLTPLEYVRTEGKTPRNFAIDPTGSYLVVANQDSGNLVLFRIDPRTGRLTSQGKVADVPSPVCVTFVAVE